LTPAVIVSILRIPAREQPAPYESSAEGRRQASKAVEAENPAGEWRKRHRKCGGESAGELLAEKAELVIRGLTARSEGEMENQNRVWRPSAGGVSSVETSNFDELYERAAGWKLQHQPRSMSNTTERSPLTNPKSSLRSFL